MKKRICALWLLLVLLAVWTIPAAAGDTASGSCGENMTWTLNGTTLTISGSGPMEDFDYSNPAPWKDYANAIVHLEVEDGVTTIGSYAMSQCRKLLDVSLPESVVSIGDSAFYYCDVLENIELPQALTTLGSSAFEYCAMLQRITIPQGVAVIPDYAFDSCTLLSELTLHDGITALGDQAFRQCTGLTSMIIPASVTEIGSGAFCGCTGLMELTAAEGNDRFCFTGGALYNRDQTELIQVLSHVETLILPDTLTKIRDYALYGCEKLTGLQIPDGVTYIGDNAFDGCGNLAYLVIPASVEELGYGALDFRGFLSESESVIEVYYGGNAASWEALMEQAMPDEEMLQVHYETTEIPAEEMPVPSAEEPAEVTAAAPAVSEVPAVTAEPTEAASSGAGIVLLTVAAVLILALGVTGVVLHRKKAKSGV